MKSTLSIFVLIVSVGAQATTLPANSHLEIVQVLTGPQVKVNPTEEKTFYFANDYGQVITLRNTAQDISLTASAGGQQDSLSIDFQGSKNSQASYEISGKALTLNQAEFDQINDAKVKYDDVVMKVQATHYGQTQSLTMTAQQKTYFKLDSSNSDSSKWTQVPLTQPEIKNISVSDARFILGLSADDMQEMGQQAAQKVQDKRSPSLVSCEMTSEYLMNCDYYLETDYTPDTLHSVFSIKEGKISELLDAGIEPGC